MQSTRIAQGTLAILRPISPGNALPVPQAMLRATTYINDFT
jgi:hypothetical protein